MATTIVAMFESRADAQRAAELLTDAGYSRQEIDIRSDARTAGDQRSDTTSWWEWLFGESDEREYYNEGLGRGAALLSVTTTEERVARARSLLEAEGAAVEAPTTGTAGGPSDARVEEEERIPVVEEQIKIGKRPVARGGVRVYSRVTETPVEEDVSLREERVKVERRRVDRPLSGADDDAFRERSIELTETSEEPVVAKEARVVEEVRVGTEVGDRVERVSDTVRRTDVEVEKTSATSSRRHDSPGEYDGEFRRHWATGSGGRTPYEQSRHAYGYGCDLAADPTYATREWAEIEPEARRTWEAGNPGTWETFRDAIRYAWDRVRGGRRAA